MVSLEFVFGTGCALVGAAYILSEYLSRESWKYITKDRNKYPCVLSALQFACLALGCLTILGVVVHLMINGGGV